MEKTTKRKVRTLSETLTEVEASLTRFQPVDETVHELIQKMRKTFDVKVPTLKSSSYSDWTSFGLQIEDFDIDKEQEKVRTLLHNHAVNYGYNYCSYTLSDVQGEMNLSVTISMAFVTTSRNNNIPHPSNFTPKPN